MYGHIENIFYSFSNSYLLFEILLISISIFLILIFRELIIILILILRDFVVIQIIIIKTIGRVRKCL